MPDALLSEPDPGAIAQLMERLASRPLVPTQSDAQTLHIGDDDLPWAPIGDGSQIQLLHVDLDQNLWILKTRFPPNYRVDKHYHTGPVFAVTLKGRWFYLETPDAVSAPGSYLFEPAGSVHTLATPADQQGETEVWFAIHGANLTVGEQGGITQVIDARFVLDAYCGFCGAMGLDCSRMIVVGK